MLSTLTLDIDYSVTDSGRAPAGVMCSRHLEHALTELAHRQWSCSSRDHVLATDVPLPWMPMGQLVTFLSASSPRPGMVRFELNRTVTGMGHERYNTDSEITGHRPVDELARRLLATGDLSSVHIHGSMVTAEFTGDGESNLTDALPRFKEAISGLYTYYVPGVEIPGDDEFADTSTS